MMYAIHKRTKHHVAITEWNHDFWHYYIVTFCEDWNFKKADPDGWIEWQGDNEKPLPDGSEEFEIRTRRGDEGKGILGRWTWGRNKQQQEYDIIAYRPILTADTKPEPPAWDGEGLPPVGSLVEISRNSQLYEGFMEGDKVEVLAHKRSKAADVAVVWSDTARKSGQLIAEMFRPIRSEEDQFVDEMVRDLADAGCEGFTLKHYARILYKAGYRK